MPFPIPVFDAQVIEFVDGREYIIGTSTFTSSKGDPLQFSLFRKRINSDTPVQVLSLNTGDRVQKFTTKNGRARFALATNVAGVGITPVFQDRFDDPEDSSYFLYVGEGLTFTNQQPPNALPFVTFWGKVETGGISESPSLRIETLINQITSSVAAPNLAQLTIADRPFLINGITASFSAALLYSTGAQENLWMSNSSGILGDYITSSSYQTWCIFSVHSASFFDTGSLNKNDRLFGSSDGSWGVYVGQSGCPNFFHVYGVHSSDGGSTYELLSSQITGTYDTLHVVRFTHDRSKQTLTDLSIGLNLSMDNITSASFGGNDFITPLTNGTLSSSFVIGSLDGESVGEATVTELVVANSQSSPGFEDAVNNYFDDKYIFGPLPDDAGPSGSFPTELSGVTYWGRADNVEMIDFLSVQRLDTMPNKLPQTVNPTTFDYELDAFGSGFGLPLTGNIDRRKTIIFSENATTKQELRTEDGGITTVNLSEFLGSNITNYHIFSVFTVRSSSTLPPSSSVPQDGKRIFGYQQVTPATRRFGAFIKTPTTASSGSINYDFELNTLHIQAGDVTGSTTHFLNFDQLYLLEMTHDGSTLFARINSGSYVSSSVSISGPNGNFPLYLGASGALDDSINMDFYEFICANAFSSGTNEYQRVRNYLFNRYNFGSVPTQPVELGPPALPPSELTGSTFWFAANLSLTGVSDGNAVTGSVPNLLGTLFSGQTAFLTGTSGEGLPELTTISGTKAINFSDAELSFRRGAGSLTNENLLGSAINGSQNFHMFMAFLVTESFSLSNANVFENHRIIGNSNSNRWWGVYGRTGSTNEVNPFFFSGSQVFTTHSISHGNIHLLEYWQTGSLMYSQLDDGDIVSSSGGRIDASGQSATTFVGGIGAQYFSGSIFEFVIASQSNRDPDGVGATADAVRQYFLHKYNFVGFEPQPPLPQNPSAVINGTFWGDANEVVTGSDSLSNTVVTQMYNKFSGSTVFINTDVDTAPVLINDPLSGQNAIKMLEDFTITSSVDIDSRRLFSSGTLGTSGVLGDILGNPANEWHVWIVYSLPNVIPLDDAGLIQDSGTKGFNHQLFGIPTRFFASPDFREWGFFLSDGSFDGRWDAPEFASSVEGPSSAQVLASQLAYNNGLFLVELRYPNSVGRIERVLCRTGSFASPSTATSPVAVNALSTSNPGPLYETVYMGEPSIGTNHFWPGNIVEVITAKANQPTNVRNALFSYFGNKYGFNVPTIV